MFKGESRIIQYAFITSSKFFTNDLATRPVSVLPVILIHVDVAHVCEYIT